MTQHTRTPWCGRLLLAGAATLLALAVAEAALRAFRPLPDPYRAVRTAARTPWPGTPYVPSAFPPGFRRRMRSEAGLPGMDGRVRTFSVNQHGFRGGPLLVPKPPGELRVFLVGGSNVEGAVLGDRETIGARLEARLRSSGADVRVYGAGKSADRTADHVAMVAHRIAHLEPDLLVVFPGMNDMAAAAGGRAPPTATDTAAPRLGAGLLLRMTVLELQLARLVRSAVRGDAPSGGIPVSRYREAAAAARRRPPASRPPRVDTARYAGDLRTLVGIGRGHAARVVLVTQPTTWLSPEPAAREWHWMTGDSVRYPEAELDAALAAYNEATRAVGRELGAPVLDLAGTLPRSLAYFYDDMHFNVRGADEAAARLAALIEGMALVAPPRAPNEAGPPTG